MKKAGGARISVIIAIVLSVAILAFLFIFPSSYAKRTLNEIIDIADECIVYCAEDDFESICRVIPEAQEKLEKSATVLKLFYTHDDVAEVQNSLAIAVCMVENNFFDAPNMLLALSGVIENAEHIIECDTFGWDEFM